MQHYESLVQKLGYVPSGHGFKKLTENYTHWITFYDDVLQMYGYFSEDVDFNKEYDTGMVTITSNQLEQLIEIFTTNHN